MIERLLEADRLLALGLVDQAERIYWQAVEADPRNAIAVVGLARVASEKGDDRTALEFARKAAEIDPENPAAVRLSARLQEIIATREAVGTAPPPAVGPPGAAPSAEPVPAAPGRSAPTRAGPTQTKMTTKRRGLLGRLLGGR